MGNRINLSERLKTAASYLPAGAVFADIGSDHAYLPCYICQKDDQARAVAGEVRVGPYNSAVSTVKFHGLTNKVDVRLGDGLEVLSPNEVNQIVIAGMGGSLIQSILQKGIDKLGTVERIIAQPNVNARNVRRWLRRNNYMIVDEQIVEENGHIYEVLAADKYAEDPFEEELLEQQLLFGPILLEKKPSAFYYKWEHELAKLERVIDEMKKASEKNMDKISQFEMESAWIREVLGR
ncbi:tRNA (adenine(22)-N(1))-methyltransferase [Virgibacillus sediminis]|uniref:tRNA (Adenine(22)-N(1))-methyltransferase n=1 Tax=Virgibacillus sediminis TaxID=202260 RepID=A0ABV7A638_9BACI